MQDKLAERKQVVDALITNAILSQPSEDDPTLYRVLVPGAIREENFVNADDEDEAVEKVRAVLMVKEQSRLESLERLEAKKVQPEGEVTVDPASVKISVTKVGES